MGRASCCFGERSGWGPPWEDRGAQEERAGGRAEPASRAPTSRRPAGPELGIVEADPERPVIGACDEQRIAGFGVEERQHLGGEGQDGGVADLPDLGFDHGMLGSV